MMTASSPLIFSCSQRIVSILFFQFFYTLLYEKQLHSILFLVYFRSAPVATTALSIIGYLFIDRTWITVYLITSEIFQLC